MFWPPVGSATRSNRRGALPHLIAPLGAPKEGTGAAALCPCRFFLSPLHPLTGALRIATAPACRWLCRPCRCLWRLSRAALGVLPTGESPCHRGAGLLGLLLSLYFPGTLLARLAMYCRSAPASRPGPQRGGQTSPKHPVTVDRRITPPTAASERSMIVSCHAAPQCSDTCHAYLPGGVQLGPGFSRRGSVHVRLGDWHSGHLVASR